MPVQDESSPATIGDEGLERTQQPLTPFVYPDFTQESVLHQASFRPWSEEVALSRLGPSAVVTLYKEQWTTLMAMADEIAGIVIGQDRPRAPRQSGFGPTTSQW
jgi:hypothetical protein